MYYFDLEDGERLFDKVGVDLANDAAARQEASLRALNGQAHQISHYRGKVRLIIRNANGADVHAIPIRRSHNQPASERSGLGKGNGRHWE